MDKRDEFLRMLRDCRKGKIDRIITKSISRFARNTKECLSVIRELKELGITVMFEKEGIDTAKISDEMMITIMGGLAQEESVSISNNLQWAIHKRMKNGTFNPPSLPYGYKRMNGKIIVTDDIKIVEKIFHDFISGKGIETIAFELNSQQIFKGKDSVKWSKNSVRYILKNEKYTGDSIFQKYYTTSQFPFRQKENKGEKNKYFVSDLMPAVISKDIFYKVQNLLEKKTIRNRRTQGGTYSFSKKIKCGNCGKSFRRKKINGIDRWVCTTHNLKADDCYIKGIEQAKLEDTFIKLYNTLKAQFSNIFEPLLTQFQELRSQKHSSSKQYMEISKRIAELKEQLHVLTRLKTKGFINDEKYFSQTAEINAKIEKQNQELRKTTDFDDEDEIIEQIKIIASIIEDGTILMTEFDEIMFESLIEKIVVKDQNTLEFQLYGGLKFTEKICSCFCGI